MANFDGGHNGHRYRGEFERDGNDVAWGVVIEGIGQSLYTRSEKLTDAPPTDALCLGLIRVRIHEYIDSVVRE